MKKFQVVWQDYSHGASKWVSREFEGEMAVVTHRGELHILGPRPTDGHGRQGRIVATFTVGCWRSCTEVQA